MNNYEVTCVDALGQYHTVTVSALSRANVKADFAGEQIVSIELKTRRLTDAQCDAIAKEFTSRTGVQLYPTKKGGAA